MIRLGSHRRQTDDLALRHPADDPSHRAGWLVDLPDWTLLSAPEVGAEAYQVTSLIAASWQLARIWTPDLLPDPVPILTTLLEESGIAVRSRAVQ